MLLDEYLNYLEEDKRDELEEKFAIARRLKLLVADPLKKRKYSKALKQKIISRQGMQKPKQYREKIKQIKTSTQKGSAQRKAKLKALAGGKEFKTARIKGKAFRQAEKAMKRRKFIRTSGGLTGVGGVGFLGAKRADERGKSL